MRRIASVSTRFASVSSSKVGLTIAHAEYTMKTDTSRAPTESRNASEGKKQVTQMDAATGMELSASDL